MRHSFSHLKIILHVGALALLLPALAHAQGRDLRRPPTPTPQPAPGPTDNTTLKAQWEIAGPAGPTGGPRPPFTSADAAALIYRMYKIGDAAGVTMTGTACTTTVDPYTKTCQALVPTVFDVAGTSVDMTVVAQGVESPHSTAAVVPGAAVPPASPLNFRFLRSLLQLVRFPLASRGHAPTGHGVVLQVPTGEGCDAAR